MHPRRLPSFALVAALALALITSPGCFTAMQWSEADTGTQRAAAALLTPVLLPIDLALLPFEFALMGALYPYMRFW